MDPSIFLASATIHNDRHQRDDSVESFYHDHGRRPVWTRLARRVSSAHKTLRTMTATGRARHTALRISAVPAQRA